MDSAQEMDMAVRGMDTAWLTGSVPLAHLTEPQFLNLQVGILISKDYNLPEDRNCIYLQKLLWKACLDKV
jgi:hypothetical protein